MNHTLQTLRNRQGFTLIELVMVVVLLGILSAVAVPKMQNMIDSSKTNATLAELATLKSAIQGNPQSRVAGVLVDRGFNGHMGYIPTDLNDLIMNPGSTTFNKFTQSGWNGPYVTTETLTDAWGTAYSIDTTAMELKSLGPDGVDSSDDIILTLN